MSTTKPKKRPAVNLSKADALGILSSALNVLADCGIRYTLGNNEHGLAIVVNGATISEDGAKLLLKE